MKMHFRAALAAAVIFTVSTIVFTQETPPVKSWSESQPYLPIIWTRSDAKNDKKSRKPKDQPTPSPEPVPAVPVTVPVSVFNGAGKFVTGIKPGDFKLFLNGTEQPLTTAEVRREPLNVVLLIDSSPSADVRKTEMMDYARKVVDQLRPDDKVMIATFNEELKVSPFTSDRAVIDRLLAKWRMGEGTSIYDSITELLNKHLSAVSGPKAIILLTDGIDITSTKMQYESSLIEVEKSDVSIYPVFWDTTEDHKKDMARSLRNPFPPFNLVKLPDPEALRALGVSYLDDLADATGGRAINYRKIQENKIAIDIPSELHTQYVLTFTPTEPFLAGQRKKVQVRVNHPNLVVRARGTIIRN